MSDDIEDKDKPKPKNKLIVLPGGKKIDMGELGMNGSLVSTCGTMSTAEIIDPSDAERELREREVYVKKQELVQAAYRRAPVSEMVEIAVQEISEELAHLKFERRKAAQEGKPTSQHTIARIASLRNLAEVLLKRQENARVERMDFRSPEFKKVIHSWLEFVYSSMLKAGIGENDIDICLREIESNISAWEQSIINETK